MIDRRNALGLMASATIGAAVPRSAVLGADRGRSQAFDPTNQDHLALAFRKLAFSANDKLTFWWMRGTRYGVTGSVATPFWDMHVASWFTTRDLPDGKYEVRMASANFYTAPGAAALLEKFLNPYTGETVDVPYGKPRVSTTVYDRIGGSAFGRMEMPGMKSSRKTAVGPAWIEGDTVHVQGDLMLRAEPVDPTRKTFTVNDWSTYIGAVADVMNPSATNPAAAQMFNDILDYPGWLQMGDHPGGYVSRCYGRKVYNYSSMPALWRKLFEARFPDAAKDPGAILKG